MYTLEVIPGVHQVTIRRANMFLIIEKELTLIDTGFRGSIPYLVETIRNLGRLPEEITTVILTHNHLDHTGGIEELKKLAKIKVFAHHADVRIDDETIPYPAGNYIGKLLKTPLLSPLRRHLVLGAENVDVQLEGGEILPVLDGLQVVMTPGHTPGSISLYAPEQKLLFVGDALNKRRDLVRLPLKRVSTNLPEAEASVRRMSALDVQILCFGHGRPVTEKAHASLQALIMRLERRL